MNNTKLCFVDISLHLCHRAYGDDLDWGGIGRVVVCGLQELEVFFFLSTSKLYTLLAMNSCSFSNIRPQPTRMGEGTIL